MFFLESLVHFTPPKHGIREFKIDDAVPDNNFDMLQTMSMSGDTLDL